MRAPRYDAAGRAYRVIAEGQRYDVIKALDGTSPILIVDAGTCVEADVPHSFHWPSDYAEARQAHARYEAEAAQRDLFQQAA